MTPPSLTLGYVPGGTPAKWARIWAERHPGVPLQLRAVAAADAADAVRAGVVDVALLRPLPDPAGLAVIPLYDETTVAVVPVDHHLSAADAITAADLDGEPTLVPLDDVLNWDDAPGSPVKHRPETTEEAIELVAAGLGALIVPQSLARLYHRKDLTYRPIADAPTCPVALAFPEGTQSALVEEFIGIVRGRKPGSSRGQAEPAPKRTAREKTLAKQAARATAGKVARKPGRTERGRR
ncbi:MULTISPECIES: LysR family substrate-binding domain-containing protein [Mycobacteroides]|uniref:LysR family transcriptional regulator n=1 Tax=Mycobacteroides chelonae TaxID=1774 RepID=A0AB73LY59_MYCCH|nr:MULTISPECIES: LysR family substrate-binding domain-containing protein [Mycobacteroides]KRQ28111.1 LysR family transcriptional regulator [Mycobacteroides sp. H072]KRQ34055.1 LysR family transcriptional regulator [Mycobacteroides sp. H002]KRQ53714.1 LysR family transcriptional regulator [Mycobacteroides sp. H054]KRQ66612.1 LysR family transcriptional regulator [Mycobacteroides sp. H001]MBF9326129.1 LysR family substrate-binding domain-containing protein [Mycobacteroides chelonae]